MSHDAIEPQAVPIAPAHQSWSDTPRQIARIMLDLGVRKQKEFNVGAKSRSPTGGRPAQGETVSLSASPGKSGAASAAPQESDLAESDPLGQRVLPPQPSGQGARDREDRP